MKRYACIHGHFYQPPRENPWTGAVERQLSSGRDHDWNARIARECYVPNTEARVLNERGAIIDIIDNYAWMSFNFGPTLLAWMEKAHPHAYARILEADRLSAQRLGGHGNAMAQSFHHAILPLASPRDRETEIQWGLADFRKRFGRQAEGLWLPECAVDEATLISVADAGVKFVILEPHQALDDVRPGIPYLWEAASRRLALFFYDGAMSRSVAFEGAMRDSRTFASRLVSRLAPTAEDGLALVATDGESYGHHESFAEMGLAHFLRYALAEKGVESVNLGWYLETHPPRKKVRLRPPATSWSCSHGVERWRSACGCGAQSQGSLEWRAPLREALEGLQARLDRLYESKSRGVFPDPWRARNAYIDVVLDRGEQSVSRFLAEHAPGVRDENARVLALTLLEIQRHSLMMFTSCGWFFDSLSRLEPVQVLLYAARALELASALGEDFEPEFLRALALAPSIDPQLGDGAGVWNALVKPQIVTPDHLAAHFGAALLVEDGTPSAMFHYRVESERCVRRVEGGVSVASGRATFVDGCTGARWTRSFFAAILPGQRVQVFVSSEEIAQDRFEALLTAAAQGGVVAALGLPAGRVFLLRDLRPDERERVLTTVLKRRLSRWAELGRGQLEDALALSEQFHGLNLALPPGLGEETLVSLAHAVADCARRFASDVPGSLDEMQSIVRRASLAGLSASATLSEEPFSRGFDRLLSGLENGGTEATVAQLIKAVETASLVGLTDWRAAAQVRVFRWMTSEKPETAEARRLGELLQISPR